jgi:hypothetical protein
MKFTDYIPMWINGLIRPEETVKKLEKSKPKLMDGIKSTALLGVIAGIICFICFLVGMSQLTQYVEFSTTTAIGMMFLIFVVLLPIVLVIGLMVWTMVFRIFASYLGGKGSFDEEAGFFGIIAGSVGIVLLPSAVFSSLAALVVPNIIAYYLLFGIGVLIAAVLTGIINGVIYQTLSSYEKTSIPRSGLLFGITQGLLTLLVMILGGLFMSIVAPEMAYYPLLW